MRTTMNEDHPMTHNADDNVELARAVGELGGDERPTAGQIGELTKLTASSARRAGARAVTSGRWLADVTLDAVDHMPVRDLKTLMEHHRGQSGSLLAGSLIRNASLATATVGAATGAMAAASQLTPATWATLPVELAAETLAVVAIEIKLVGELHEAAGIHIPGMLREKGPVLARAWADSRGLRPKDLLALRRGLPGVGGAAAQGSLRGAAADMLGRSARDQLTAQIRKRLLRRAGGNLSSMVPFLAGAVAGGELNRRATRSLGTKVATSLGIPPPP
jgi:hypothetical protein